MNKIHYKKGYKYQLTRGYQVEMPFIPHSRIDTTFIRFSPDGLLTISAYYAWDGPSGPTIDTKSFMRASLEHDALYQLMRQGHLPQTFRKLADKRLKQVCIEDGMWRINAALAYRGVRLGGRSSTAAKNIKLEITAPS